MFLTQPELTSEMWQNPSTPGYSINSKNAPYWSILVHLQMTSSACSGSRSAGCGAGLFCSSLGAAVASVLGAGALSFVFFKKQTPRFLPRLSKYLDYFGVHQGLAAAWLGEYFPARAARHFP